MAGYAGEDLLDYVRKLGEMKSFIVGVVIASFLWGLLLFLLDSEYSVPAPAGCDSRFSLFSNPITENLRLSDTLENRTLLWTPGNPPVRVVEVKEIETGKWSVVLEKVY